MALLSDSHHEVMGVDRSSGVDVSSRHDVMALVTSWRPDVVIHAAAFTDVDRCESEPDAAFRVNALGTRFVAEAAARVGAHVVYISTDYVFDGTKDGPYVEWDETGPLSVYGASKLAGERELDRSATIVRTSWVCGRSGANMVRTILRLSQGEGPLRFVDDQFGHPTFAADLAPVVLRLAVERARGVHHVTNAGDVSWYDFARAVLEAAGEDAGRVEPISTLELDPPRAAARPHNSRLANTVIDAMGIGPLRDFRDPLLELVAEISSEP